MPLPEADQFGWENFVFAGQDIGPPLTLYETATGNGVPPIAGTWPQRPAERVPERTVLPQLVPSCTG
jgi:hypothetical protein